MLIIGFFFFINPTPWGLDILPDVFGCVLIWLGLNQLSFFDGSIEESRKYFLYLTAVELIHLLMMRSIVLTQISTNRMLAVTSLSILQGILYILIFKKLFGGISYFAVRHNCNKTLNDCDGTAFMSYFAFFAKILAALVPELFAILEIRLDKDFDETHEKIAAFVAIKPVVVVLLSAIALGVLVAWYVSACRLISTLTSEAGSELDGRYFSEFTSDADKTALKRLRYSSFLLYFALAFIIDFAIDGVRVIPAALTFLILYIATYCFKPVSAFSQTRIFAIPAFLLLTGCEIFTKIFNPYGAIVIYETDLTIVALGVLIGVITSSVCMLCVRGLLYDIRKLSLDLNNEEIPTFFPWIFYCFWAIIWTVGFAIPYLYPFTVAPKLIFAALFVWQVVRTVNYINEKANEHHSLYGSLK